MSTFVLLLCTILDPVGTKTSPHTGPVLGVVYSPDQSMVATLSRDGLVVIWNAKTKKVIRQFSSPRQAVALQWPIPERLCSIGSVSLATMDPGLGKVLRQTPINQRVDAGAISRDGRMSAVGNTHFVGKLLDVTSGKELCPYPSTMEWSYAMTFSPDGTMLAVAGRNTQPDIIALYETTHFKLLREWPSQIKEAFSLTFSPDSKSLLSVGDSQVANLWDAASGKLQAALPLNEPGAVAAAFTPDGRHVLVGSGVPVNRLASNHFELHPDRQTATTMPITSCIQMWNVGTRQEVWRSEALKTWPTSLTVKANGQEIASGHPNGQVRFWNVNVVK